MTRRVLGLALLAALCAGAPSLAQDVAEGGDAPAQTPADVPPGPARITGTVSHAQRPDAASGVDVVLYALRASSAPGLRHARADASGRFAFEGLSNAPDVAYLVGARYRETPFPGERVVFEAGELAREVAISISDPTEDPEAVKLVESRVRLDWLGPRLSVTESHSLRSSVSEPFYVPAARRGAALPALRIELPAGASAPSFPFGIPPEGIVARGAELHWFGPVYAGDQRFDLGYSIDTPAGQLVVGKRFASPAQRAVLLVPATGARVDPEALAAQGFARGEDETLEGRSYWRFERPDVAAGTALKVALEIPSTTSDTARLSVPEARLYLELDDALLQVREEYRVAVSGDAPVATASGAPILEIPLPPGAQNVRFSGDFAPGPLEGSAQPGLGFAGPFAAGENVVEVAYRLPAGPDGIDFARSFRLPVSLLSVFFPDTGLLVESDRLHRRRPIKTEDLIYSHFEAFEIAADEPIALRLTPIDAPRGAPVALRWLAVALASIAALGILGAPLTRGSEAPRVEGLTPGLAAARDEREAIVAALRDLDDDFDTGKLEADEYESLRAELRARALGLLQREREASQAPGPPVAPAEEPVCARCAAAVRAADRYCAQCGAPLVAREKRA
jgi:hypothetical protein